MYEITNTIEVITLRMFEDARDLAGLGVEVVKIVFLCLSKKQKNQDSYGTYVGWNIVLPHSQFFSLGIEKAHESRVLVFRLQKESLRVIFRCKVQNEEGDDFLSKVKRHNMMNFEIIQSSLHWFSKKEELKGAVR